MENDDAPDDATEVLVAVTKSLENLTRVDADRRFYVIKTGSGYSCLGFDVAEKRRLMVNEWLGRQVDGGEIGTAEHYAAYLEALKRGHLRHQRTRDICPAELTPALHGLEGRRVALIDHKGRIEKRYWVGRSGGWMPTHIELHNVRSKGGPPAVIPDGWHITVVDDRNLAFSRALNLQRYRTGRPLDGRRY